jgi:hypothetical protein
MFFLLHHHVRKRSHLGIVPKVLTYPKGYVTPGQDSAASGVRPCSARRRSRRRVGRAARGGARWTGTDLRWWTPVVLTSATMAREAAAVQRESPRRSVVPGSGCGQPAVPGSVPSAVSMSATVRRVWTAGWSRPSMGRRGHRSGGAQQCVNSRDASLLTGLDGDLRL